VLELAMRDRPVVSDQPDGSRDAGARIGIVVGRKNLSRAVDRNALKRIVREAFRARRSELPPRDLLFRLRQRLSGLPRSEWKATVTEAVNSLLSHAALPASSGPGRPGRANDRRD
jgi:ribonuclease P protein component